MLSQSRGVRLGLVGWPVSHSRSPAIQNAALAAEGLEWRYQLLPVVPEPPQLLAELVAALPGAGFRGVNVTIPHKRAALQVAEGGAGRARATGPTGRARATGATGRARATGATERARAIGAANTLVFGADGAVTADNTDAPALIEALRLSPAGRTALVLGAGGSARAAVWALLDAGASDVRVWNRTPERALELARELGGTPVAEAAPADLLVNCTAVGLVGSLSDLPVGDPRRFGCVVDLAYRPDGPTELVGAAAAAGVQVVEGLEVLLAQGALSFELFTDRAAPRDAMRAAIG